MAIRKILPLLTIFAIAVLASGCLHYTMKESSIDKNIKTIHIGFIENRARFVNPQLSQQLTERLRQKVNNQTSKSLVPGDNADLDISGAITDYSFTTAAIADNRSATNRLNITVHVKLVNRLDEKKSKDQDVSRSFDFDANVSIDQAQTQLMESILKNLSDEIFNSLFSDW
ncbi:MAG: LptE family protein [Bacteroidota bacterium]